MKRHLARSLCASLWLAYAAAPASAQISANARPLALPAPVTGVAPAHFGKASTQARADVVVQLATPSLLEALGPNARRNPTMTLQQRRDYMARLKTEQDAVAARVVALGAVVKARVGKAYNAVVVSAPLASMSAIAGLPGVAALRAVPNARLMLSQTVPSVGAAALHASGLTGAGIKIAVLDSGIDYTHRNLGGSGSRADFAAASADPRTAPAGLFPTAKVIGGYDFVGDAWPNGDNLEDPNPIDAGSSAGHGTHVADIAAGRSLDGSHKGVAPDAKLYAVKVCSSVSLACLGYAVMLGLDWVVDPNGDLDFSDAADVVNLSLGSAYGHRESPDTAAVSQLVRFGMVVVAAAGNAGDKPFVLGAPSNAVEAISVAQTGMPNGRAIPLVVTQPAAIAGTYGNTNTLDWAPIGDGFSGALRLAGPHGSVSAQACTLADTVDFTGSVALIERGNCNISLKVKNAATRGAVGVLLANNVAGDAPSFTSGGDTPVVPTLVITKDISERLRSVPASTVRVTVSPQYGLSTAAGIVPTSARGPSIGYTGLKPEIAAPGGSISALFGSGTVEEGFSGTSGAAPMVSGAAALLLQRYGSATPAEIKARLMNSAHTAVFNNPATQPGVLAPISRTGAGELRVDRAAEIGTALWDATNPAGVGLAFGSPRLAGNTRLVKKVAVRNYTPTARVYSIAANLRYADDAASGAVKLSAPATVNVPGNSTAAFILTLDVDTSRLPDWTLGAPGVQGNGSLLQGLEFDGHVTLTDSAGSVSLPWHVLPHKAANVSAGVTSLALRGAPSAPLALSNSGGSTPGTTEVFALTGRSARQSAERAPYGGGYAPADLKAVGVRPVDIGGGAYSGVQFAIATWGERTLSTYPAEFDIYIDSNNDGVPDYAIYNAESGGFGASGQSLVYAVRLNSNGRPVGDPVARYFVDSDVNSSHAIFTVAAADIGLVAPTQRFNFSVRAYDNLLSGFETDAVENMAFMLGNPKFTVDSPTLSIPAQTRRSLTVTRTPRSSSPSQSGLLLLHRDARSEAESELITVTP